jgi:signal transduction histidine kinase
VTAERDLVRTKDELVSVVSHELRTPLASVVGFAELLLVRPFTEAQRREFLTTMLQKGKRLTALMNDFLDLQRMQSERPVVLELLEDPPLVLADADRIQQVLVNLLSNARKYSPAGGEVQVSARAVDNAVEVTVADRGLGIPPEALPRLFEKFYRIDNSDRP